MLLKTKLNFNEGAVVKALFFIFSILFHFEGYCELLDSKLVVDSVNNSLSPKLSCQDFEKEKERKMSIYSEYLNKPSSHNKFCDKKDRENLVTLRDLEPLVLNDDTLYLIECFGSEDEELFIEIINKISNLDVSIDPRFENSIHREMYVRQLVREYMSFLGENLLPSFENAYAALVEGIQEPKTTWLVYDVVEILYRNKPQGQLVHEKLHNILSSNTSSVNLKSTIIAIMGEIGVKDATIINSMASFVGDNDPEMAYNAARSLAKISESGVLKENEEYHLILLNAALNSPPQSPNWSYAVARALSTLDKSQINSIPLLRNSLKSPNLSKRFLAAMVLSKSLPKSEEIQMEIVDMLESREMGHQTAREYIEINVRASLEQVELHDSVKIRLDKLGYSDLLKKS